MLPRNQSKTLKKKNIHRLVKVAIGRGILVVNAQIYGVGISPKETTAIAKERPNLHVEVEAKTY